MPSIWPSDEQFSSLNELNKDQPVTMLNLLAYRDIADYADYPGEISCSGKEAYRRYSDAVFPLLKIHGAKVVLVGAANPTIIGPQAEKWDDVMLVEYPTPLAFIAMSTSQEYAKVSYHRSAALTDSRLIPMATGRVSFQD